MEQVHKTEVIKTACGHEIVRPTVESFIQVLELPCIRRLVILFVVVTKKTRDYETISSESLPLFRDILRIVQENLAVEAIGELHFKMMMQEMEESGEGVGG